MGTKDPRTVKSAKEQLDKKIGIKLSRSKAEKKPLKKLSRFSHQPSHIIFQCLRTCLHLYKVEVGGGWICVD